MVLKKVEQTLFGLREIKMKDNKTDKASQEAKVVLSQNKVGMGGCHLNKKEVFEHAWEKGVRLFDTGWG